MYEVNDEYLTGGRIIQYAYWIKIGFFDFKRRKERNERKSIEYKRISFENSDLKCYEQMNNTGFGNYYVPFDITIPTEVKEIGNECFLHCYNINNLIIYIP